MDISVRPMAEEDHESAFRLGRLAFGAPPTLDDAWRFRARNARGLLAEVDGRLAGQLRVRPYGQLFGGRSVPMGGVAAVSVEPWARGRGVAQALLDAALPAMHEAGQAVSALYATVPHLYRSRGWERSGVLEDLTLAPSDIAAAARAGDLELRPARPDDLADLHACYRAVAGAQDGMLDREEPSFRLADVLDLDVVTICPGRGYLTATRHPDRLQVHDLVALDEEVGRGLIHQLSSWAGLLKRIDIRPTDPLPLGILATGGLEGDVQVAPWMLRMVDLPAAVAARGWPAAPTLRNAAVDLSVDDPWTPWNAGRWRLVVEDGAVRCEPGGDGLVRLRARALGPWFAGGTPTSALRRAGLLDGAGSHLLDALVAGRGTPRMADYF